MGKEGIAGGQVEKAPLPSVQSIFRAHAAHVADGWLDVEIRQVRGCLNGGRAVWPDRNGGLTRNRLAQRVNLFGARTVDVYDVDEVGAFGVQLFPGASD